MLHLIQKDFVKINLNKNNLDENNLNEDNLDKDVRSFVCLLEEKEN